MRALLCSFACLLVFGEVSDARRGAATFHRTYECAQGHRCQRTARPYELANAVGGSRHASLQACRLVCSPSAGLWPIPTGPMTTGANYLPVNPESLRFPKVNGLGKQAGVFLKSSFDAFKRSLQASCGHECEPARRKVDVRLAVESSNLYLGWETNEAYSLEIATMGSDVTVIISAATVYGARHGLETLSQLIVPVPGSNGTSGLVMLDSANIRDKPVFQHRGLLIDTGRNFLPVRDILRTIDGLASVKMNVLHWHATDTQSFPIEIRGVPLMAMYGAYGPDKVYSVEDMQQIVRHANSKGVRVIVEIDSPSHAGAGWEWGESEGLGKLAVCVNQLPWRDYCIQPPCGQLNPVNPNTFDVLRSIYKELLATFGRNQMMHLGGDELFIDCWNSTEEVTQGMSKMDLGRTSEDFLKVWSSVHKRELEILDEESQQDKSSDKAILWSSQLTAPEHIESYLDKAKFVVQTWVEADKDLNARLLDLGYQLIVSTKDAWYLDHGFWGSTKYHSWRDAYNNRIPQHQGVLGGEACMWGEYVASGSLDARVWPRAAAVAERLWSDPPSKGSTAEAEPRLQAHIDRLRRRTRVLADAIAPEWCDQHEGQCQ
ncbi:chitooligosaccharidolytic beta-N-acetylglucosaminidase [Phymastichus coffea]|uniref:chitooligosaccharidolytic beta-N-acetylglucosaminidase n=1 Tax=Phymastichus coffea TaxID=108790 RepID=UPI00273AF770|nr:chitooligosaccharidolytic beta-N-acetylglucosaminidase [Phymastichus coffea]